MDKAYKNNDFMMGRDARVLRILSEYLEPQARFACYKIADTVVFFGSARALPRDLAEEALANAKTTANETAIVSVCVRARRAGSLSGRASSRWRSALMFGALAFPQKAEVSARLCNSCICCDRSRSEVAGRRWGGSSAQVRTRHEPVCADCMNSS